MSQNLENRLFMKPTVQLQVLSNGTLEEKDENRLQSIQNSSGLGTFQSTYVIFDISKIQQGEALRKFLTSYHSLPIQCVRVDGRVLLPQHESIEVLSEAITNTSSFLSSLVSLRLDHINFQSFHYIQFFNRFITWINPSSSSTGNFGKLATLRLYDCSFATVLSLNQLLNAIRGNVHLEELEITLSHPPLTDQHLSLLKTALVKYETNIRVLSLCHHDFSEIGCADINQILSYPRNKLQVLNLSNNPNLLRPLPPKRGVNILSTTNPDEKPILPQLFYTSKMMKEMMIGILSSQQLQALHLPNCQLRDCHWSCYLSFLPSLAVLNLSFNQIDDQNIMILLQNIIHSFSIRDLQLASNHFHEAISAPFFSQLLQNNQSIQCLDISMNRLPLVLYQELSKGIAKNQSLLQLKCQHCEMGWKELEALVEGLTINTICELSLDHNLLPIPLMRNVRQYLLQEITTEELSHVQQKEIIQKILPLAVNRERQSIEFARRWRQEKKAAIQLSLQSIYIVQQQQHRQRERQREQQLEKGINPSRRSENLETRSPSRTGRSRGISFDHTDTWQSDHDHGATREALEATNNTTTRSLIAEESQTSQLLDDNLLQKCWTIEIIEQSEYFHPPNQEITVLEDDVEEHVIDKEEVEEGSPLLVTIYYGRMTTDPLGVIEIKKRYHYQKLWELIEPLLQEYCQSIDPQQREQFLNVSIYTMQEELIPKDQMKKRKVWKDVQCEKGSSPSLLIRPATWMKI